MSQEVSKSVVPVRVVQGFMVRGLDPNVLVTVTRVSGTGRTRILFSREFIKTRFIGKSLDHFSGG